MKILHISYSDLHGGAGKTAYRIHRSLLGIEDDSRMLVLYKTSKDSTVFRAVGSSLVDRICFHAVRIANAHFDTRLDPMFGFSSDIFGAPKAGWLRHVKWADIVHLHFVTGFLASRQIAAIARKSAAPIVWTIHDFASFTGGCHYPDDCTGWHKTCGYCPRLKSKRKRDLSRYGWRRRASNYRHVDFRVTAYSAWAASQISASSLAAGKPIHAIPSAVDPEIFRTLPKRTACDALALPWEGYFILCVAADFRFERKGLGPLLEVLRRLRDRIGERGEIAGRPVRRLTLGHVDFVPENDLSWERIHLGFLADDRLMALAYQAADILVCTSLQETGPQTIVESMMCGTPVAALRVGLVDDIIAHDKNGYIAQQEAPGPLADSVFTYLSERPHREFRAAARAAAVAKHAPDPVARSYHALYEKMLESGSVVGS